MLINNQKHPQVGGRIRTLPLVMCQEPVWVPKVIQTSAPDLKVTPAVEEMVRLEGHYWAKSWAKGRKIEIGFAGFSRRFLNIYHLHFIYISFIYRHIIHTIMHIHVFHACPFLLSIKLQLSHTKNRTHSLDLPVEVVLARRLNGLKFRVIRRTWQCVSPW